MKNGEFTIKEISELLGQTRGAIRFYEEKGLIHPRRDHNDFRYYSLDDLFQLFYLKRYASLSLSLDEVSSYFRRESSCSLDEIQSMLQGKQMDLDSEIERLQRIKTSLQRYSSNIAECREPVTRFLYFPDYYSFRSEDFEEIFAKDPEQLQCLIQAMPETTVHGDILEDENGVHYSRSIGITRENAQKHGIIRHPKTVFLPASLAATKIIRVEEESVISSMYEEVQRFRDELEKDGKVVHSFPSSSLVLVHQENGKTITYQRIYIPVLES